MKKLRKSKGVLFGFPAPKFGLNLASQIIDIEPALLLNSVNFTPQKLIDKGFKFKFEKLEDALKELN
jgi:NAD dependent epimerase/dehydratase family enzyme